MVIYNKQKDDSIFLVSVLFPNFTRETEEQAFCSDETNSGFLLDFSTRLLWERSNVHKRFIIRVLGFGVVLFKQTGY